MRYETTKTNNAFPIWSRESWRYRSEWETFEMSKNVYMRPCHAFELGSELRNHNWGISFIPKNVCQKLLAKLLDFLMCTLNKYMLARKCIWFILKIDRIINVMTLIAQINTELSNPRTTEPSCVVAVVVYIGNDSIWNISWFAKLKLKNLLRENYQTSFYFDWI